MGLAYARPLEAVGALPVQLPFLSDPAAVLGVADGVLLGFGSDIDPARYGGAPHPSMTEHSARRDEFELALARLALDEGLPVLGICRGMQLLNVVRGGTLLADVAPHPGGDWERWALVRAAVLEEGPVPEHPGHSLRRRARARGSQPRSAPATTGSTPTTTRRVDRLGRRRRAGRVGRRRDRRGARARGRRLGARRAVGAAGELEGGRADARRVRGLRGGRRATKPASPRLRRACGCRS